jgi:crotonobetainyl-CoA:carnitine CoA-transferase CaiB-like acyl-CoA transferase
LQKVVVDGIGELRLFGMSAKLEKTPGGINAPPPRLSAHTHDILSALGYSQEEIKRLKEACVI